MGRAQHPDAAASCRRIGYASTHATLLLAAEWRLLSGAASPTPADAALFAAALAVSAAFYVLQELLLHASTKASRQRAPSDAARDAESAATEFLLSTQGCVGCDHEIEYRRERIEHIKAALLKTQHEFDEDADANGAVSMDSQLQSASQDASASVIAIKTDEPLSKTGRMDFCADCELLPPLRAHHCGFCGRCVATFDHHCLLLGTCIGEKNHCRFWWFLLLQSVEIVLAITASQLNGEAPRSPSWTNGAVASLVLLGVLWALFLFIFSLWCFHTFLALANLTTWEFARGADALGYLRGFGDCDLPFSRGPWLPEIWAVPDHVERDSPRVWSHLWENKYYSCC